mmetsp:Transcript_50349/g.145134  ORF Transcript_50349/g.145134 Transcript_50349/m.145134 type:complete len:130 (-) Transcript_50349:5-394(-)
MEAALQKFLQNSLGEYISGGLSVDASRFPLTLKNLRLNERKIQAEIDDDGGGVTPFQLSSGAIGSISVDPGWMCVEIRITDLVLNLSFSASRAVRWATRTHEKDEKVAGGETDAPPPPPPPPPPPAAMK